MTKAEEGQRRGEAVISLSKRWRYGGLSILTRGGVIWHSLDGTTMRPAFGYRDDPFRFDNLDISSVVTIAPKPTKREKFQTTNQCIGA